MFKEINENQSAVENKQKIMKTKVGRPVVTKKTQQKILKINSSLYKDRILGR